MDENREIEIETLLYHQAETIKELTHLLSSQQISIYHLEKELKTLKQQMKIIASGDKEDNATQKPPHY